MSLLNFSPRQGKVLWMEPHRLAANGQARPIQGLPTEDQLAQTLTAMPLGPTKWIIDDLWAPAIILRDIVEAPGGGEAREAFFRWKYTQALALEGSHAVQTLPLGEAAWVATGIAAELRENWIALAARLTRPIHALVPRWLWLYNRLAPSQELPGMLLSLCPHPEGGFTGTLAAWSRHLTLLRQWADPASEDVWMEERVHPTASYLSREGRGPRDLWVWGAPSWTSGEHTVRMVPPALPTQEAL